MKNNEILNYIENNGTVYEMDITQKKLSVIVNNNVLNEITAISNIFDEVLGNMQVEFPIRTTIPEKIKLSGCIISNAFKVPFKNIHGTNTQIGILTIRYEAAIYEK